MILLHHLYMELKVWAVRIEVEGMMARVFGKKYDTEEQNKRCLERIIILIYATWVPELLEISHI